MIAPSLVRRPASVGLALITFALLLTFAAGGTVLAQEGSPAASLSPDAPASGDPANAAAAFDPAEVRLRVDLVAEGLDSPVYVAADGTGSGCLYIVQRGGTIRLRRPADGTVLQTPWLDISKLVTEGPEQGLHAIAFHPDFAKNGRFFVHYNDKDGRNQIAEFKGSPCRGKVRPRPVRLMLREEQQFPNNNAGWIGFGPDGYLYIPLGDGGGVSPGDPFGIGQSRTSRLSKVLRIDVNVRGKAPYRVPRSNPFARKRGSYPPETWAMGLRDPRRASFDRATGDLWIGDVGQDRFEEVNRIPAGESALNFGWSDMEGDQCHNLPDCDPSQYELPVHQYDSVSPQCGVVGGYVYRGGRIPGLEGVYVFTDFCSGFIWGLDAAAVARGERPPAHLLLDAPQGFTSLGEDDDGELYAVSPEGSVYSIGPELS